MGKNRDIALSIMAYRNGRSKSISMSSGTTGELYRNISQKVIQESLTLSCHQRYITLRDSVREAVELAGQGQYNESRLRFEEVENLLNTQEEHEEVRLLGLSWMYQGAAYLESRLHNWEAARQQLDRAMLTDYQLENKYNYSILHIARVHLVYLHVRLEITAGNLKQAMMLVQQISEYVTGQRDGLTFGKGWSREQVLHVLPDLRKAMLLRISSEAGIILANASEAEESRLFEIFSQWREYADDPVLSEIYQWGVLKKAWIEHDIDLFLAQSAIVLNAGRRETVFWYNTVLDFYRCCERLRPKETHSFREEILSDAKEWERLPSHLFPSGIRAAFARLASSNSSMTPSSPTLYMRRFRIYSVGLPRTGTSSLSTLFGMYRSANEFMEQKTISYIVAHHFEKITRQDFHDYLYWRDREGELEMDAASFNHFYLDFLVKRFPESRFIFTIRDPYSWTNSYMNMLLRWKKKFGESPPKWTTDYGKMLFGDFDWNAFTSPEHLTKDLDSIVKKFLQHWGQANRNVLALLPPERSLIVNTKRLSFSREALAHLADIPSDSLTDQHHTNRAPNTLNLLKDLNRTLFIEQCHNLAGDVLEAVGIDPDLETPV